MIKNYLKIAWRNLWKNKLFSFINIIGLAVGIACCILIYLYVQNEVSYDKYNEKADRIYRLTSVAFQKNKTDLFVPTSRIMSKAMQENFPEVLKIVRFNRTSRTISYKDKKFYDIKLLYSDSTLFDIFTFPFIAGNPQKALVAPYSIVLTESTAKKCFGSEPPLGKMLAFSDSLTLMVTGVMKDIPQNSHINFECIVSGSTMADLGKSDPHYLENNEQNWFNCNTYSYILIDKNVDPKVLETKANKMMEKEMATFKKDMGMWFNIYLQPLTDIHLHSKLEADYSPNTNSDIMYVYIFSGTAILILLIACCNFINLSTARSLNRSKEIGLRKVIGANRIQLITQFLGESLLFCFIASILSIILVLLLIPVFNSFIGTTLSLNLTVLWIYIGIILVVGVLAGFYPAMLMSSFAPIRSLKGKVIHSFADVFFRKGLVVFQFTVAIILIIGTTLVLNQLDFIQNQKIGINKDQVLNIELRPADAKKYDLIIKELSANSNVINASVSNFSFKQMPNITLVPEGIASNEVTACNVFSADENFLRTMKIELAAGRDFSKDFPTDVNEAFIVNEAAVKEFGWKNPKNAVGKKVEWGMGKNGKIIGVVKDFNYKSLHENVEPVLMHIFQPWFNTISLRLKTQDLKATMNQIENTWKNTAVNSPFKYTFLEDDFNTLYRSEVNMRSVLSVFTFLSILVACLGLFGLAAFTIKQRFKEIGIRKVLGSSVPNIVQLLSKDFLKLVVVSIIIASPVAWFATNKWLQDFAYKVEISWWIFLFAGILALLIAYITVAFQAIKAAIANPIKSLRTE